MSEIPSNAANLSTSTTDTTTTGSSRRSVLRAAAWTTPVIAFATAAPAFAASYPKTPGINGWIEFHYPTSGGNGRVTVDATGTYPARGLWINDVVSTTTVSSIYIVFHFRAASGTLNFTKSGSSQWSNLTRVGTIQINGGNYISYRSNYTGPLPLTPGRTFIPNDFVFTSQSVSGGTRAPYIDRFVTIDGAVQSFRRLIGGDGALLPTTAYTPDNNNLRQAQVEAPSDGAGDPVGAANTGGPQLG
ncbi:hypothetical protein [Pseudoclavibacter helvolus]|uniref:hypothetical protein n=1 Tax=Pseudoclavibacter helvolus TaxID=255205 RepID=UPI003C77E89F